VFGEIPTVPDIFAHLTAYRLLPQRGLQFPRSAEATPPADLALQEGIPGGLSYALCYLSLNETPTRRSPHKIVRVWRHERPQSKRPNSKNC
jgi:hypothetical protein